jgi:DNA-binding transcriptional ArsR family regulator
LATPSECDVAGVAALLAEPARAAMLLAVLDGRALPAGELGRLTRVAPATASAHLARLVAGGCLAAERQGRHRYFRLASPAVARALEALALVAPAPRAASPVSGLRLARSCFDHLAGWLAVRLADALVDCDALTLDERGFLPGVRADATFAALGVDLAAVRARARAGRRPLARVCRDWSERRPHVAGALGAALLQAVLDRGWAERLPGGRALRITADGRRGLTATLGIRVSDALVAGSDPAGQAPSGAAADGAR